MIWAIILYCNFGEPKEISVKLESGFTSLDSCYAHVHKPYVMGGCPEADTLVLCRTVRGKHDGDGHDITITDPVPSQDIPSPGAAGPARAYPRKDHKGKAVARDNCQGMGDTLYCAEGAYGPSGFNPGYVYIPGQGLREYTEAEQAILRNGGTVWEYK